MRVGTSDALAIRQLLPRDHPHACGDKVSFALPLASCAGSSPCVWGQVVIYLQYSPSAWIIPMRVGTSFKVYKVVVLPQDHPHACGDKLKTLVYTLYLLGSSPCVWGQEHQRLQPQSLVRIIPMRVGTRVSVSLRAKKVRDHPHACGDKISIT